MKQRVLVVDPDSDVREVIDLALRDAGYRVLDVADVEMARLLLEVSRVSWVVLLDYGPRANTKWQEQVQVLLNEVARLPLHAWVLLSALPAETPADLYNPHTHRIVPVLSMPFTLDELTDSVEQAAGCLAPAARLITFANQRSPRAPEFIDTEAKN